MRNRIQRRSSMKKTEYAIVDIETTGGNAGGSRITEIAIIIYDGTKIIDRWETLVNPQKEIPLPIFALTGINNEMVQNAPVFEAISEKVFEMLTDRIFVAHNVNFDYSFIRYQLEEAGWKWSARKLCTVRAARKIKPGLASYSLGNLCRSLDIALENRHRAGGDADATAVLLDLLIQCDDQNVIQQMIKNTAYDQRLPPNLPAADFEQLPQKPGVYYFYNQDKKVIYVGKAVNIKKRVASHFSGNKITPQRQHFLRDIYGISFEVCATELMALLLECTEIKKLWPVYNKALKRFEAKYGLYEYTARNGYKYLAMGKIAKFQTCIEVFNTVRDGTDVLLRLTEQFKIDHRFCKYSTSAEEIPVRAHDKELPPVEVHNKSIEEAIEHVLTHKQSYFITDKGRVPAERSCIWVEEGQFYGMGYIPAEAVITRTEEIKEYITRYKSNEYIMQLIHSYATKHTHKVVQISK